MRWLTLLRILSGLLLTAALGVWAILATLQWLGRFAKGAAQAGASTVKLFASGFTKSSPSPQDPSVDVTMWLAGAVLLLMWVSVFVPGRQLFLHATAVCAVVFGAWHWWAAPQTTGPWAAGVVLFWGVYYYVAAWRN